MDATTNFGLRFAQALGSAVETAEWLLNRQVLRGSQLESTAMPGWRFRSFKRPLKPAV
jgi:hypothetical protein